jgi:hypothetical protein
VAGASGIGASPNAVGQALSQYRTCKRDGDCPAALGDCVTEIPFDKPDAKGRRSISVAELFPTLGAPGICTYTCTTARDVCSKLSLRSANGTAVPFTCQLVAQGQSFYTPPRDTSSVPLDSTSLNAGDAYGAICQPPFGIDPAWPDSFCQPCSASCADGALCWDVGLDRAPSSNGNGVCLGSCSATKACPAGFDCLTRSDGQYCVPTLGTCSDCRDADHDGRGLGHCTATGTTAVDCDDKNASAYFDATAPDHAFPNSCGELDYNCNGLWDKSEILSRPKDYGALHCGACNAACAVPATGNVLSVACSGERCLAMNCAAGWLDCNGDLSDGCEAAAADNNTFEYYLDGDADGYGAGAALLLCKDLTQYVVGTTLYVRKNGDCNDTDPSIHPGAIDYCDGVDSDCDGSVGEDGIPPAEQLTALKVQACAGIAGACLSHATLSCNEGRLACVGATPNPYEICGNGLDDDCDGAIDAADPNLPKETCNGRDDDCDGNVDSADDWMASDGDSITMGNAGGGTCVAKEAVGACREGHWTCNGGTEICVAGAKSTEFTRFDDTRDGDCNGVVDVESFVFFAKATGAGCPASGSGTHDCPYVGLSNLNQQLTLAKTAGKNIVIATGAYAISGTITLVDGVSIQGGYERTGAVWEQKGGRSTIERDATISDTEYKGSNVAVAGLDVTTVGTKLMNLELSALGLTEPAATHESRNVIGLYCYGCSGLEIRNVGLQAGDARSQTESQPAQNPGPSDGSCHGGLPNMAQAGLPGPRAARFEFAAREIWGAKDGPNGRKGGNGVAAANGTGAGCGGPGGLGSRAGGSSIALQILQSPSIQLVNVTIRGVGKGGKGGNGGPSGKGGAGLPGAGDGGDGAGGGGGDGGHAIGIVVDATTAARITKEALSFAPEYTQGKPGLGGDGGAGSQDGTLGVAGARGPDGRSGLGLRGYCLDCSTKLSYADAPNEPLDPHDVECRQLGNHSDTTIDPDGAGDETPFNVTCRNGAALVLVNSYPPNSTTGGVFPNASIQWDALTASDCPNPIVAAGSLDDTLTNVKAVTCVSKWMKLGNTLRVDMGSAPGVLTHQAGYPFTLQDDTGKGGQDAYEYPLWLTTERVTIGSKSFGLFEAGPQSLSYGESHDATGTRHCGKLLPGPFWYGVNSSAGSCYYGTIWGAPNPSGIGNLPIWNQDAPVNFGAFWIKDVVARKSCDGLAPGAYLVDSDYVGKEVDGSDAAPAVVQCSGANEVKKLWGSVTHTYLFYPTPTDWYAARAECLLRGADLVTINDNAEQLWLDGQIASRGKGVWWLGLNAFLVSSAGWGWADGTRYDNWNALFVKPTESADKNCTAYDWSTGLWTPGPCRATSLSELHPFICEMQ